MKDRWLEWGGRHEAGGLRVEIFDKETIISKEMRRRPVSYLPARASILWTICRAL